METRHDRRGGWPGRAIGGAARRGLCALLLVLLAARLPALANEVQADRIYLLAPADAAITFAVEEWGGLHVTEGRFTAFDGSIVLDGLAPLSGRVDLLIDAASVAVSGEAGEDAWREHELRGSDFFDTDSHPQIRFVSRHLERLDGRRLRLDGSLTIRGVTRPASFSLLLWLEPPDRDAPPRLRFSATAVIDRTGFGMTAWPDVLGRDVQLSIDGSARPGAVLPAGGVL